MQEKEIDGTEFSVIIFIRVGLIQRVLSFRPPKFKSYLENFKNQVGFN